MSASLQKTKTVRQHPNAAYQAVGWLGLNMLLTVALSAVILMTGGGCRLTTAPTDEWTTTSSTRISTTAGLDVTPIAGIADASVSQRVTIQGEAFDIERHSGGNIKLTCTDGSGEVTVFIPADVEIDKLDLTTGETYRFSGIIQTYRDQLEMVPEHPDDIVRILSGYAFPAVQVISVVDGDTLHVRYDGGNREKVRIIGIDSPELAKDGQPAEYYAEQARDYVTALLLDKTVYLEQDHSDVDRYGRQLRYVWLKRPDWITAEAVRMHQVSSILLSEGYATFVEIGLDNKYETILRDNEKQAQEDHLGLWSDAS